MLISYKTIKGPAIIHCVITSGGVRIAAKAKVRRMAYFRLRFKSSGVTSPILVRKKNNNGKFKNDSEGKEQFDGK